MPRRLQAAGNGWLVSHGEVVVYAYSLIAFWTYTTLTRVFIRERRRMHGAPMLPDTIYHILRDSTLDIRYRAGRTIGPFPIPDSKRFDFDSGYGFLSAPAALDEVADEVED